MIWKTFNYLYNFFKLSVLLLLSFNFLSQQKAQAQVFHNADKVELGRLLFFDKILSGNKNISCSTCHHPSLGTSDGLSLGIGEGGLGIGPWRFAEHANDTIHERVPRNSPALFNLNYETFSEIMFHDARIHRDMSYPSGFRSPAFELLPEGLESIVAVQALFPVTSATEMAGQINQNGLAENIIAEYAALNDFTNLWKSLVDRIIQIPEYVSLILKAYPNLNNKSEISIIHIANSIAAFEQMAFDATQSPFDFYQAGDDFALTIEELEGMQLFYGKAQCASCHSGYFQTDNRFYSIGLPTFGPGKGVGAQLNDDFGLEMTTQNISHRYKFKTPSLRNVEITGPWGHNGAYSDLREMIKHHLNPHESLENYDIKQAWLPYHSLLSEYDFLPNSNTVKDSIDIEAIELSEKEIDLILRFLSSLTDPNTIDMSYLIPESVPSGLPVLETVE